MSKSIFRRIWDAVRGKERRLSGASVSRYTAGWQPSWQRINGDLKLDFQTLVHRARDLARNNEYCVGYLRNMRRNVIGPQGFSLQCQAMDSKLRATVEHYWREYQGAGKMLTLDRGMTGREFDVLILRTLLIDGEVFIHRVYDPSGFGWRYEIIDSLLVDPQYNVRQTEEGNHIVMGVELDPNNAEVAFHVRESFDDNFCSGNRVRIPAEEVQHIFLREYADQSRGISAFSPLAQGLFQLADYKEAELLRSRMQAYTLGIWERNNQQLGDQFDDTDEKGAVSSEMKAGAFIVAPEGYTAKFLQSNAPASQFGAFWKDMLRGISNALGISYNKAASDYDGTSYSSLREAQLEDRAGFEDWQNFLIENWKTVEFTEFVRALAFKGIIPIESITDASAHKFIGRRFAWVDPQKEIGALEREFAWHLTDPLTEIEQRGRDPEEVLMRWKRWNELCAATGVSSTANGDTAQAISEGANNDAD